MINVVGNKSEILIYLDNEGIDELIHCLTYLREKNETSYDLIEGNELTLLDEDLIPKGFSHIPHLELIFTDAYDRQDGTVRVISED